MKAIDVLAYLKQQNFPFEPIQVRPLTPEECEQLEDLEWACRDVDVQATYPNEFVVPYRGQIVAHGHDAAAVLEEAALRTGECAEDLPLVGISDPLQEFPA